jgi:hypothetical protein
MKRGGPDHPKTLMLADILGVPKYAAVGLLEMLFHFTAQYAPEGDIGRYSDKRIATGMAWRGKPAKLLAALASSGWIDRMPTTSPEFATTSLEFATTSSGQRWVVHGWSEHCDRSVLQRLHREGKSPLQSNHAVGWKVCTISEAELPVSEAELAPALARASALPVPDPEPNGVASGGVGKTRAASRARHPSEEPPPHAAAVGNGNTDKCCYPALDLWPETDAKITNKFPTTEPALRQQVIESGIQAHRDTATNGLVLTDKILAKLIVTATKDKQHSAKLYLTTLPIVVANEVRKHEREKHERL